MPHAIPLPLGLGQVWKGSNLGLLPDELKLIWGKSKRVRLGFEPTCRPVPDVAVQLLMCGFSLEGSLASGTKDWLTVASMEVDANIGGVS